MKIGKISFISIILFALLSHKASCQWTQMVLPEEYENYSFTDLEVTDSDLIVYSNDLLPVLSNDLFAIDKMTETFTAIDHTGLFNLQNITLVQSTLFAEFNNDLYDYNFDTESWDPRFPHDADIYNLESGLIKSTPVQSMVFLLVSIIQTFSRILTLARMVASGQFLKMTPLQSLIPPTKFLSQ